MFGEKRLGDIIDDFCVKCRRLTNHSIVSLVGADAAKVRCRTCYHDHDFRNGVPLPSKKELKKQQLFDQVLAGAAGVPGISSGAPPEVEAEAAVVAEAAAPPAEIAKPAAAAKKGRKTAKR